MSPCSRARPDRDLLRRASRLGVRLLVAGACVLRAPGARSRAVAGDRRSAPVRSRRRLPRPRRLRPRGGAPSARAASSGAGGASGTARGAGRALPVGSAALQWLRRLRRARRALCGAGSSATVSPPTSGNPRRRRLRARHDPAAGLRPTSSSVLAARSVATISLRNESFAREPRIASVARVAESIAAWCARTASRMPSRSPANARVLGVEQDPSAVEQLLDEIGLPAGQLVQRPRRRARPARGEELLRGRLVAAAAQVRRELLAERDELGRINGVERVERTIEVVGRHASSPYATRHHGEPALFTIGW